MWIIVLLAVIFGAASYFWNKKRDKELPLISNNPVIGNRKKRRMREDD